MVMAPNNWDFDSKLSSRNAHAALSALEKRAF